jgi:hypothetical protein
MTQKPTGIFGYLCLLTLFFLCIEVSFLIQSSGFYFGDYKLIANHIAIPVSVIPGLIFFGCAHLFLHLMFTVVTWIEVRLVARFFGWDWAKAQTMSFVFWFANLFCILLANQVYFPNSKYAELLSVVIPFGLAQLLYGATLIITGCLSAISLWQIGKWLRHMSLLKTFVVIIAILDMFFIWQNRAIHKTVDASSADRPNIIFIGIDSLRPDFVHLINPKPLNITPNIDRFLTSSVLFKKTYTPLARTYPSWVSILTGQYPKSVGVRFDIPDQTHLHFSDTLPQILQGAGYHTLYSMDETRFSNIDKNLGFDEIITPPVGFNDFVLGNFNDFPFSNIIVNTHLGRWLFPYSFGNRPAFITYNPNSYLTLIQKAIYRDRHQPLFLAMHLCLPHFPYLWQDYAMGDTQSSVAHYRAAITRSDQQVGDLIALLEKANLLHHAIVVLLSDHGEALELTGDRITAAKRYLSEQHASVPHFYPPSYRTERVDQSAGHGTDVLGLSQYKCLLAFRRYGETLAPEIRLDRVNLLGIKPTILSLLHLDRVPGPFRSLLIRPLNAQPIDMLLESDFSPEAVRTAHPETRQLLFEGIDYFHLDPKTAFLTVKPEMAQLIISSKQYADIYGDWMLALYPQADHKMTPILIHLRTLAWSDSLTSPFAKKAPVQHLLRTLQEFYGTELGEM